MTCLRRLERNGLIERRVIARAPLGVEYAFTELGYTLDAPVTALLAWTAGHADPVRAAQTAFDLSEANTQRVPAKPFRGLKHPACLLVGGSFATQIRKRPRELEARSQAFKRFASLNHSRSRQDSSLQPTVTWIWRYSFSRLRTSKLKFGRDAWERVRRGRIILTSRWQNRRWITK
jgi:hypothetical protein